MPDVEMPDGQQRITTRCKKIDQQGNQTLMVWMFLGSGSWWSSDRAVPRGCGEVALERCSPMIFDKGPGKG